MIQLFSGTPGSGKSLHMAAEISHYCNHWKDRLVICNFPVNTEKFRHPERFIYLSNRNLENPKLLLQIICDFYVDHPLKEAQIFLFIDECQVLFNARNWRQTSENGWLPFFSQHRKYGIDIYLVAQFDEMIDKQIRCLIEYEILHRKLTNFGFIGGLIKIFTFGDVFIAIQRWYTINQRTGVEFFKARKKYYRIYDTFATFQDV